ncbi:unnamed protein product [Clonostachys chloroleuca]|uniref:CBM21 domain-containing protein n=1 Tax=Clonostachys chloroleuca TaxID=1926264 RepID=A0AA35M2D2_9HYPO|nr:unnamed protein product [Clonostachys chloroleuca]CAI6090723.1 unnamed protein product [Clonostachys chloroleuca]CAI6091427.1 unnamed protein product [Clonostachys chloroleuca]
MDGQRRARTRRASDGLPKTILRPAHNRRAASIAHLPRVRFDSSLEDVRTFYKDESPSQLVCSFAMQTTCVRSGGGTPSVSLGFPPEGCKTASTWFLRHEQILFSKGDLATQNVHLDKLAMAPDRTLRGSVLVKNLTYVKSVFCRFTLDGWATFSDVCASYSSRAESGGKPDGYDRFEFSINQLCPTAFGADRIILCVCFVCNGQSYWDNNDGANYNIPLVKETPSLEEGPTVLECHPPEPGRAKNGQNVVRSLIDGRQTSNTHGEDTDQLQAATPDKTATDVEKYGL